MTLQRLFKLGVPERPFLVAWYTLLLSVYTIMSVGASALPAHSLLAMTHVCLKAQISPIRQWWSLLANHRCFRFRHGRENSTPSKGVCVSFESWMKPLPEGRSQIAHPSVDASQAKMRSAGCMFRITHRRSERTAMVRNSCLTRELNLMFFSPGRSRLLHSASSR